MSTKKLIKKVSLFSLELTNICNLECDFCASRLMSREKGMMDVEVAKRLIKEVRDTKFCNEIVTNVMGDPLLYKDLSVLLKYASMLKQKICVLTNGEGLDEDITVKLFEYPPSTIGISYHSHNDKSYSYKHSNLTYKQYKERIFKFIESKFNSNVKTFIGINVISTINSPHDKFKILDNKEDINLFGREWITFAKFIKRKHRIIWDVPDSIYTGGNWLLPDLCVSINPSYHTWSGDILPSKTKVIPSQKCSCLCPFIQFNVLWNGDLTLCCIDYNGDLVYDNIKNKSIIEAFNSDKIIKIRQSFIEGENIPKKCAYCYEKILNLDGSSYNPNKKLYKLSILDKFKRGYFVIYGLLRQGIIIKFFYTRFMQRSKMGKWLQKKYWANYYKNYY